MDVGLSRRPTPKTTSLHRLAARRSGYTARLLRLAAVCKARPGSCSAPRLGSPLRVRGHTNVVLTDLGSLPEWQSICQHLDPARVCGACGSGAHRRPSRSTRIQSLGMRNSGAVGRAMMARGPPEPACDTRRARDAGSRSRKRLSSAIVSKLAAAERCQPRKGSPNSRPSWAWVGDHHQPEFPTAG